MNLRENMLVIDGQIKTGQIMQCTVGHSGDKYNIVFKSNPHKTYTYSRHKVIWLTRPVLFNPKHCHVFQDNRQLYDLSYIAAFQHRHQRYWYIEYANGTGVSYPASAIRVVQSCLNDPQAKSVFAYLRSVAAVNALKSDEDDTPLLLRQYQNIDFIADDRAAAGYLNPKAFPPASYIAPTLIFPFGGNASQQKAVQAAFEHQLSIIQGPPGTGKTQTILNIIANILIQGKSVMVVSNNNSAIANVVEKLERHAMGFVTALLGSRANKEAFVATQKEQKSIPADIAQWHLPQADSEQYLKSIQQQSDALAAVYSQQERLALARQQLDALDIEAAHFQYEVAVEHPIPLRESLSSDELMELWQELQSAIEQERAPGFFARLCQAVKDYFRNRRLHQIFAGLPKRISLQDTALLIPMLQQQFYTTRRAELTAEIGELE